MNTMKQKNLWRCLFVGCSFLVTLGCEDSPKEQSVAATQSVENSQVVQKTQSVASTTSRGPDISLEVKERDFGTIWDFETVTTTFPFTNTGSKTLVLTRLQAGCGCTTPIADKTILQPGETGTITVTFDPNGKANKQDKKVTIFSNSVNNPEQEFWIRSFVNSFVRVQSRFLNLNKMKLGQPSSIEFDFFPADPDFKITSVTGLGKHGQFVSASEIDVPEGAPRRIKIDISPNMPWGAFHSQVQINGTGQTPDGKTINHQFVMFANGHSFGTLEADSYIISLGSMPSGGSYHKRVHIYRPDGKSFKILNTTILQATIGGINATSVQLVDGSYETIISGTLPPTHRGPLNAELMIQTDVQGEEILKFRIAGNGPKK